MKYEHNRSIPLAKIISKSLVKEIEDQVSIFFKGVGFRRNVATPYELSLGFVTVPNELGVENAIIEIIINTVCTYYGVPFQKISLHDRHQECVVPRQMIFYFISKHTVLTGTEIGEIVGGFHYTTVSYANKTISHLRSTSKKIAKDYDKIENQIKTLIKSLNDEREETIPE